jgi:hypothetical protein
VASGWYANDVLSFQPLYDQVMGAYCVVARVRSPESSGGEFCSILRCEHANKLRAIAP